MINKIKIFTLALIGALLPKITLAHEAYVMETQDFWQRLSKPFSPYSIQALNDVGNFYISLKVAVGVFILLALNYFFRRSKIGKAFHGNLEKLSSLGPVIIRVAIAVSFFYSAKSLNFLGPELSIAQMPFSEIVQWGLYLCSALILFGFLSELAGIIALTLFTISAITFNTYILTYAAYLGEIIILIMFGSRNWSIDKLIFGPLKRNINIQKYEASIIRVFYGLSIIYTSIFVKILHPDITIKVVEHWNLTQFNWLFPSDPILIALGAGLVELAVGIFILIGFELRLTAFISLFYMTLSLFYFQELLWPHLLMYAISINFLVRQETFTLDSFIFSSQKK